MKRLLLLLLITVLTASSSLESIAQDDIVTPTSRYRSDRDQIAFAIGTVYSIIEDVLGSRARSSILENLTDARSRLSSATESYGGFRAFSNDGREASDKLVKLLRELRAELKDLIRDVDDDRRLRQRLNDLVDGIERALDLVREKRPSFASDDDLENRTTDRRGDRITIRVDRNEDENENDFDDEDFSDGRWRGSKWVRRWGDRFDRWPRLAGSFVGDFEPSWPYRDTGIYRSIPVVRYNRVEGLVLGIRRLPMEWNSRETVHGFGQVDYAFAAKTWRYEGGAEIRFGSPRRRSTVDMKLGGAYRSMTSSNDIWKASWIENSLGAMLFKHDFFDYYRTEGWTAYAIARITPYVQLSGSYRDDEYQSLTRRASWSLFGGDPFRLNPAVDEGRMRSIVLSLEGGRVRDIAHEPRGAAFRFEAELGRGLGGDFSFNRYLGDVRLYLPVNRDSGLSLRFRGGLSEGEVPYQKAFTLGGVGSVRSYPQNVFFGTRMLLANAEYAIYDFGLIGDLLRDWTVLGLFDAGWTNGGGGHKFEFDQVVPAAGIGVALDDRSLRVEIAWPLRDVAGVGTQPSVWIRLNPTF